MISLEVIATIIIREDRSSLRTKHTLMIIGRKKSRRYSKRNHLLLKHPALLKNSRFLTLKLH